MEHVAHVQDAVEEEQHTEPLIQPLREVQVCLGEVMGEAKAIVEVEKFELLWYEVGAAVVEHVGPI